MNVRVCFSLSRGGGAFENWEIFKKTLLGKPRSNNTFSVLTANPGNVTCDVKRKIISKYLNTNLKNTYPMPHKVQVTFGTKCSRMNQAKFVEDIL